MDQNASHTPGPWRLAKLIKPYSNDPELENLPYAKITAGADGNYDEIADQGFTLTGIMSSADAHLIVASPDLLEALKAMFRVYGSVCSSTLCAQASDAIAKAEGR